MKDWFINFITDPKLSSFEAAGISAAVGGIVTTPSARGLLIALAVMLATAAIVSITKSMKDLK